MPHSPVCGIQQQKRVAGVPHGSAAGCNAAGHPRPPARARRVASDARARVWPQLLLLLPQLRVRGGAWHAP